MASPSFHDVRLPVRLAYGSTAGLERQTEIASMASGFEQRNSRWAHAKRKYNIAAGPRPIGELINLLQFFEARGGRLYGFRWQDKFDFQSCELGRTIRAVDQTCLPLDKVGVQFQLQKTYTSGATIMTRSITKPIASSVVVAVAGRALAPNAFTLDALSGKIRLASAAANPALVTAGYQFDVPVRFDIDQLEIEYTAHDAGRINAIPLIELRLDN